MSGHGVGIKFSKTQLKKQEDFFSGLFNLGKLVLPFLAKKVILTLRLAAASGTKLQEMLVYVICNIRLFKKIIVFEKTKMDYNFVNFLSRSCSRLFLVSVLNYRPRNFSFSISVLVLEKLPGVGFGLGLDV